MILEVIQPEEDKTDYTQQFCRYVEKQGVKTNEQLESRFDALATQFALDHNGYYGAKNQTLKIK